MRESPLWSDGKTEESNYFLTFSGGSQRHPGCCCVLRVVCLESCVLRAESEPLVWRAELISRLSVDEAKMLLSWSAIGHLGCITDDGPYVVPVNYALDGDRVYVHSMPGRKIIALRSDPRACLQVELIDSEHQWQSALISGRYHEITDPDERTTALRRLAERFPTLTPVESGPVHDGQSSVVIFCIRIDEISGVRETPVPA